MSNRDILSTDGYRFQSVCSDNWTDLEFLFESRGGPHNCWYMVWRKMENRTKVTKEQKKEALKGYVEKGLPVGILAYYQKEPIAWCSIAARESYRELGGNPEVSNVWSVVCFYIKKEFRRKGLINLLLRAAITYATKEGAEYIEAYPVDKDSPSYQFMGLKATFEKEGFIHIKKIGKRRNLMSKGLLRFDQ